MSKYAVVAALVVTGLASAPAVIMAQGVGLGPRFSFVRGDVPSATPSARFLGGTLRMQTSKHMVLEAALDYRAQTSEDRTSRVRERPLQGSLLLFPVRKAFAPYVLGGFGLYSQTFENLDVTGKPVASTTSRKTGAHIGFGAEIFLSRHASLYADYRLRFVRFGTPEPASQPISVPGSSFIPGLDNIKLSHKGSMWASGMAFYF
ncbi:MAG: outer membrane beta-barrel protein [Vicinamibacterales bacterium]